jgi:hypothetical protein
MTYEEYLAQMKVMGPKVNLNTPPPAPMPSFSPMGNPMTGVGGNSLLGSTPVPDGPGADCPDADPDAGDAELLSLHCAGPDDGTGWQ